MNPFKQIGTHRVMVTMVTIEIVNDMPTDSTPN
jgi:hypothetical protein